MIIYEYLMSLCQCRSNSKLWNNLRKAFNYKQYVEYVKELDTINRKDNWKYKKNSYCYHSQLVQQTLDQLKKISGMKLLYLKSKKILSQIK